MSALVTIDVFPPTGLSTLERSGFEQLVLSGGQVNPATLASLITGALAIALAKSDGELVGVGAVKRPNKSYARGVFQKAKVSLTPEQFPFELGWVFVAEAGRGMRLASRIVEGLMPAVQGVGSYATSSVSNEKMHSSLRRFGFQKVGTPYASVQNEGDIQLFVRG